MNVLVRSVYAIAAFVVLVGSQAVAQQYVITPEIEEEARCIVSKMTLEEKIDYLGGDVDGFSIHAIPRLGLPKVRMADGPQGLRNNVNSTYYPCGIMSAASWDRTLMRRVGNGLGDDFRSNGIAFILGPGVCMYRSPLCGRNFEYFGEDPYLSSETALQYILGVQERGTIATIKHFAFNNQEYDRHNVSSDVDERTAEEIYFLSFRKAIEKGHVGAVMSSYNPVNDVHAAENPWLLRDKLRKEWGFKGVLMSDWGATYDGYASCVGGLDIEMPTAKFMNRNCLLPLVKSGVLPESIINEHVQHIIQTLLAFGLLDKTLPVISKGRDLPGSKQAALEMARGGIVLLRNEEKELPLHGSVAVIGPNADIIAKGGGSGEVNPYSGTTLWQGMRKLFKGAKLEPWGKIINLEFKAEYFSNSALHGTPNITCLERDIDHSWGVGSPDESIPNDNFSARWTAEYTPDKDMSVILSAKGDDGFRVFIDGEKVIDAWSEHGVESRQKSVTLKGGYKHNVVMEYFERAGEACAALSLTRYDNTQLKKRLSHYDHVVLSVGFDKSAEGEGHDRTFELDTIQQQLINDVTAAHRHVTVIINSGGGVEMSSWIDKTQAVIMAWYPGQEGGTALAEVLSGKTVPSGKLPISIERRWEDNPAFASYYPNQPTEQGHNTNTYSELPHRVLYSEGVFGGYRGYDRSGVKPLFPFGFGLSYTTFDYSNLKIEQKGDYNVTVSFDITNIGLRDAAEVAEIYISDRECSIPRPHKELKGYEKVFIKKGATVHVSVNLDSEAFQFYDSSAHRFVVEPGVFDILVGGSSVNLPLKGEVSF